MIETLRINYQIGFSIIDNDLLEKNDYNKLTYGKILYTFIDYILYRNFLHLRLIFHLF